METKEQTKEITKWISENQDIINSISVVMIIEDDEKIQRRVCSSVIAEHKQSIYFSLKEMKKKLEENIKMDLGF